MTTTALHDWLAPGAVRQTNDDRPRSKGPETLDCRRQIGQDDCRMTNRTGRWHSSVTPASAPSTRTRRCNSMHSPPLGAPRSSTTALPARADRPGLQQALDYVREGDVLLVWKLYRLGRSLAHLIGTVTALEQLDHGGDRHHHARRPVGIPPIRRAGAVRARPDTRTHSRWSHCSDRARPHGRSQACRRCR